MEEAHLLSEQVGSTLILTFNRERKRNAWSVSVFKLFIENLEKANKDDSIKVVYLKGKGPYFSSGLDLTIGQTGEKTENEFLVNGLFETLINFRKILIAGVNGLAIGVGFTLLLHCDFVFCSDNAYFLAPFIKVGVVPEACSSYLFIQRFGKSIASDLLFTETTLYPKKAKEIGLVMEIFKPEEINSKCLEYINKVNAKPADKLLEIKDLINSNFTKRLLKVNKNEQETLRKRLHNIKPKF
jgi:peroxisomal 3,2-trans-enoyl-CoA isomerase